MGEADVELAAITQRFNSFLAFAEQRVDHLLLEGAAKVDRMVAQNDARLASIDHTTRNTAQDVSDMRMEASEVKVKLDVLFGTESKKGSVDHLSEKVSALTGSVKYGTGAIAAAVVLVGWYISFHRH